MGKDFVGAGGIWAAPRREHICLGGGLSLQANQQTRLEGLVCARHWAGFLNIVMANEKNPHTHTVQPLRQ